MQRTSSDCPAWDEVTRNFALFRGVRWLFLTHRGGIGKARKGSFEAFNQEQEAYLLPRLNVTAFQQEFTPSFLSQVIWTQVILLVLPAFITPVRRGLFSGRHLLPNQLEPMPLRHS